jgi:hypothetical protein
MQHTAQQQQDMRQARQQQQQQTVQTQQQLQQTQHTTTNSSSSSSSTSTCRLAGPLLLQCCLGSTLLPRVTLLLLLVCLSCGLTSLAVSSRV